jgi:hypothetical protein
MDLNYYRQRERTERGLATQARTENARRAHLELAESYRAVIEAYELVDALRPARSA